MAQDSFRVKNSINVNPKASPTLNEKGDIAYDSGSDVLKYYDGAEKTLATTTDVGTVSTDLSNHLSDTTDAHDASAISVTATGNLASTDVQAALQELQGDVDVAVTATSTFATDERLLRSDGTGRGAQASGITVTDADAVSGVTSLAVDNITINGNDISSTNTNGNITLTPNGTGQVLFPSGAASTPGIAFASDSSVGLWYAGGYQLVVRAGSSSMYNLNDTQLEVLGGRKVTFFKNDSSRDVSIEASDSMSTSYDLILPAAQGTFGQVLTNDGSGNLSWSSPSTNGINFITYGDAENNATTGWATYADAAATSPVDGTGGSANITLAASSSSPLRGTYSFLITKDAANRQGQGVSYDFTTAAADDNKKLSISWDYEASSAYTGSSGTEYMTCYVYDVTNATVIATSNVNIPYGSGSQQITFDATTSNSYRLCFHVAGTGTSAWTYKFDNVKVGPQEAIIAPAIGDWQAWTPTGSWSSNTTYTGVYKRVGDMGFFQVKVLTSGAPTSASLTVNLPTGLSIDTTKLMHTGTNENPIGWAMVQEEGVSKFEAVIFYNSSTSVAVRYNDDGAGGLNYGNVTQAVPITFLANDFVIMSFQVPIANWSSNIQLANSRVEYASNSGMTDADDTSSFVNDPNGDLIPQVTYTATRVKTVRFKNPIQASDTIQFQVSMDSGRTWTTLEGMMTPVSAGNDFTSFIYQNGVSYGMGRFIQVANSTTDIKVAFGRYCFPGGATYGAAGTAWSAAAATTTRWRVVKYSNAVPVEVGTGYAEYQYDTIAGYGATNTKIRYFTNVTKSTDTGNFLTIANSSTNGFSITANKRCKVSVTFADNYSSANWLGLSLNSSQLTTNLTAITLSNRKAIACTSAASATNTASWTGVLEAGDVLRPHTDGASIGTAASTQINVYAEDV